MRQGIFLPESAVSSRPCGKGFFLPESAVSSRPCGKGFFSQSQLSIPGATRDFSPGVSCQFPAVRQGFFPPRVSCQFPAVRQGFFLPESAFNSRCDKGFFSRSQLSVQTLFHCRYSTHQHPTHRQPYHCLDRRKYYTH